MRSRIWSVSTIFLSELDKAARTAGTPVRDSAQVYLQKREELKTAGCQSVSAGLERIGKGIERDPEKSRHTAQDRIEQETKRALRKVQRRSMSMLEAELEALDADA